MGRYLLATALLVFAQPALAKAWVLKADGVVANINVQNGLVNDVINLGDAIRFQIRFDTTKPLADGPTVSAPGYSVYNITDAQVSLTVGNFVREFGAGENLLRVLLADQWDFGGGPVDYQTFYVDRFNTSGPRPFGLGDGTYSEWMDVNAFDQTGSQRSSTSIADLVPVSNFFSSNSFSYNFFSSGSNFGYIQFGSASLNWTLSPDASTDPVPEAPTWAMMIGGFGLLGGALRRRSGRTDVRVAFA